MRTSVRIAVIAIVVAAIAAILIMKARRAPVVASSPAQAKILLFADLREANEGEDGCALIIRTVRAARKRGIAVREYDAGTAPEVRRQYRVAVDPTVIILDADGHEVSRHEGEDAKTVAAIRTAVARVPGGRA